MPKLPAFQFYPGDWLKDPELSRCSAAARGVWMDMLCLMWESEDRGRLVSSDVAWTDDDIVSALRGASRTNRASLAELLCKGVARRDHSGAVSCARMIRDEGRRANDKSRQKACRSKKSDAVSRRCHAGVTPPSSSSPSPSVNKSPPAPPIDFPATLDSEGFRAAWARWCQHRREIKKKLTPTSVKQQIKKLEELGHDEAIEAIDHSIAGGWSGIFPPDGRKRADSPARIHGEPGKYDGLE